MASGRTALGLVCAMGAASLLAGSCGAGGGIGRSGIGGSGVGGSGIGGSGIGGSGVGGSGIGGSGVGGTGIGGSGTGGAGSSDGGMGSGGSTSSAGTGGSGGATGPYTTSSGTLCLPPTQLITDFTYMPGDAAAPDTTQVLFGASGTTLSGGEEAYGSLISDVTGNDWHISGTVSDYSGFSLYFDVVNACNKIDASAFKGITFTAWGTVGGNAVTLGVSTLDDSVAYGWLDSVDAGPAIPSPGTCVPIAGNGPFYHPGCSDPSYAFSVTGTQASPQTVSANWSDFTMGQPQPGVTPTGILAIYWNVPWSTLATSYAVDLHIDNLAFIQ